jgi:putative RecB family exonuclease
VCLHRSASQLTSFSKCPRAFYLERIKKVSQLPAAWSIQGTAFHVAVEAWERSRRSLAAGDVQDVFYTAYDHGIEEATERQPDTRLWLRGGRRSTQTDIELRREAGIDQVLNYMEYVRTEPLLPMELPNGQPATEVGFRTTVSGIVIVGYIDLVLENLLTGEVRVRDLKTGAKAPYTPIQLVLYRRGLRDTLHVDAPTGDFYMARETAPRLVELDEFSDELLEEWVVGMHVGERAMHEADAYPPNPSSDNCWSCAVRHHCPVPLTN